MTDEFSKRLDNYASRIADTLNGFGAENTRLRDEARARLIALRDENDRENDVLLKATEIMRAQRDAAERERDDNATGRDSWRSMCLAAEAERDRLRKALEKIVQRDWKGDPLKRMDRPMYDGVFAAIARAALASPTATKTPDWMRPDREGEKS